jgi:hypothetical protein
MGCFKVRLRAKKFQFTKIVAVLGRMIFEQEEKLKKQNLNSSSSTNSRELAGSQKQILNQILN